MNGALEIAARAVSAAPASPATERPLALRVATWNAAFFPHLGAMCEVLAALDADVVCLQEVMLAARRAEPRNQAAWLAGALGYHAATCVSWQRPRGRGGDVILTRTPLADVGILVDRHGARFALTGLLERDGMRCAVVGAHGLLVPRPLPLGVVRSMARRTAQMRQLVAWLDATALPAIVAGDFNALPWLPEYHTLTRTLVDCTRAVTMNHRNTRPTFGLPVQIDYIFATPHFRTRACRTVDATFSDHRPVVADLELMPAAGGFR